MANEATLMYETEVALPMTVADGTGIEKGTILTLTDPNTAIQTNVSGGAVAGVAAEEKIASDGKTKLGVYQGGVFRFTASGAITVGAALYRQGTDNKVYGGKVATSGKNTLGISLETAADGETFLARLRPYNSEDS